MLKQLILLFNIVSFIIITALLPADIKIDTKLPTDASFVIDSTHIIEVTISKGTIFGFAKFQQNVPEGFEAHPVETADASFTYADGKIKFIWMAIPEQNEINISYALIPSSDAPAEAFISGKFSYLEENERKSYDIPNIPIKVISDEPIIEKIPAIASASRSVTVLGGNEYEVKVTITKEGVEGFGKLEEYLPPGAEATVMSNNKAVFSQVDDKAKFVWMAVPGGESIDVSYSVKSDGDATALLAMEGNFSYLDDNETKTVAVMSGETVEAAMVASNEGDESAESETEKNDAFIARPLNENGETVTDEMLAEAKTESSDSSQEDESDETSKEEKMADVATEELVKEDVTEASNIAQSDAKQDENDDQSSSVNDNTMAKVDTKPTTIPEPEGEVTYKVQVAAGRKLVSESFLRKTYSFQEAYGVENHEGWVKYTTGGYDVYKKARDKREALVSANHNFPGPFVTAYNSGERITVQEALMISNQKWYK